MRGVHQILAVKFAKSGVQIIGPSGKVGSSREQISKVIRVNPDARRAPDFGAQIGVEVWQCSRGGGRRAEPVVPVHAGDHGVHRGCHVKVGAEAGRPDTSSRPILARWARIYVLGRYFVNESHGFPFSGNVGQG